MSFKNAEKLIVDVQKDEVFTSDDLKVVKELMDNGEWVLIFASNENECSICGMIADMTFEEVVECDEGIVSHIKQIIF